MNFLPRTTFWNPFEIDLMYWITKNLCNFRKCIRQNFQKESNFRSKFLLTNYRNVNITHLLNKQISRFKPLFKKQNKPDHKREHVLSILEIEKLIDHYLDKSKKPHILNSLISYKNNESKEKECFHKMNLTQRKKFIKRIPKSIKDDDNSILPSNSMFSVF